MSTKPLAKKEKSSGAKYFVFTSKHHDGFAMWPSRHRWNWNSVDVGPKRDIVDGLLSSNVGSHQPIEPDLFWGDGEWAKSDNYWKSKEFLKWLYNESPVKEWVVVNDRWGAGTMGHHGGFLTHADRYDPGKLLARKWENCRPMDKHSWGFRRSMQLEDIHTVHELIEQLARTISCGGNMLLNIGPDSHGRISIIFQERLLEMGLFLSNVSEAVYGTKPWLHQNDTGNVWCAGFYKELAWYTARYRNSSHGSSHHLEQIENETIVYAWVLNITGDDIYLSNVKTTPQTIVSILGTNVTYTPEDEVVTLSANLIPWQKLPRTDVFLLKIEYAASQKKKT